MQEPLLPKNVVKIAAGQEFFFHCHPEVSCFTRCCRELELALTPYDVLRLRRATGLTSRAFLERFVIVEHDEHDAFPRLYLTMVDDGNASCTFVSEHGCTLYHDRPGACRAYPMGRGAVLHDRGAVEECFILLTEKHCRGFGHNQPHTPEQYCQEQGLLPYNRFNDAVASILQHQKIRQGMRLSQEQTDMYILALYDLDTFRKMIQTDELRHPPLDAAQHLELEQDEALLLWAIEWLKIFLFG